MASDSLTNALTEIGRARESQRDARNWWAIEYRPGVWLIETGPVDDPELIAEDLTKVHAALIVAAVNGLFGTGYAGPVPYLSALLPVVGPDSRD